MRRADWPCNARALLPPAHQARAHTPSRSHARRPLRATRRSDRPRCARCSIAASVSLAKSPLHSRTSLHEAGVGRFRRWALGAPRLLEVLQHGAAFFAEFRLSRECHTAIEIRPSCIRVAELHSHSATRGERLLERVTTWSICFQCARKGVEGTR